MADGDSSLLSGMTPQAAPFEIVAPTAAPDLIYDPGTRQAISKGEVIAYDQTPADLPAVIDRMAFADGIAGLAAAHPQPISIAAGAPVRRRDERVEIDLTGMAHRALILFAISGDGLVQALYPIGADQKIIDAADFAFPFEVHEPFGTDLVVAGLGGAADGRAGGGLKAPQPLSRRRRGFEADRGGPPRPTRASASPRCKARPESSIWGTRPWRRRAVSRRGTAPRSARRRR